MKVYFAPVYANNPYQKDLMRELAKLGIEIGIGETGTKALFKTPGIEEADIIHFHWFEPFVLGATKWKTMLKVLVFLYRIKRLKRNAKFVWTVHNLQNHEKTFSKNVNYFIKKFIPLIDAFSVHNHYSEKKLLQFNVDPAKIYLIPHGNYVQSYPHCDVDTQNFRKAILGVPEDKKLIMFLGNIRPYKGILDLIQAFKKSKSNSSFLCICGIIKYQSEKELILKEIQSENNIILLEGYVPDNEISLYLKCADLMVYPYKDILTSGALILGMSFEKMCIASNVGSMSELLGDKYIYRNIDELSNKILEFEKLNSSEVKSIGIRNLNVVLKDSWGNVSKKTFQMYKDILN